VKTIARLFCQRLDSLENHVHLVDDLRRLAASREVTSATRTILGRQALATRERMRVSREWETVSLDGCLLSVAAEFELASRDLAEAASGRLASKVKRYQDIPEPIRVENVRLVGELLTAINKPRTAHIDYIQVVEDVARCLTKGKPVRLYVSGFASHGRNLTSGELSELFSRLQVKDLWRKMSDAPELRGHLGTTTAETTAQLARNKLDAFIDTRNQIAHRGPNYQTVGSSVVLDYIDYFRSLVPALASVLDDHLTNFP